MSKLLDGDLFNSYILPLPKAQAVAKETLVIWCSLASRLGLWALKAELEDLCFAVLQVCSYSFCLSWIIVSFVLKCSCPYYLVCSFDSLIVCLTLSCTHMHSLKFFVRCELIQLPCGALAAEQETQEEYLQEPACYHWMKRAWLLRLKGPWQLMRTSQA